MRYLGVGLLVGDSGAVDERRVSEQLGRTGRETMAAAVVLVLQDGREADMDRVLKSLELRLLVGRTRRSTQESPLHIHFNFHFLFHFPLLFLSERKIVNLFYKESL